MLCRWSGAYKGTCRSNHIPGCVIHIPITAWHTSYPQFDLGHPRGIHHSCGWCQWFWQEHTGSTASAALWPWQWDCTAGWATCGTAGPTLAAKPHWLCQSGLWTQTLWLSGLTTNSKGEPALPVKPHQPFRFMWPRQKARRVVEPTLVVKSHQVIVTVRLPCIKCNYGAFHHRNQSYSHVLSVKISYMEQWIPQQ